MTRFEIHVGPATAFRSNDVEITKAFLGALGDTQVRLEAESTDVFTGADIALLMVERATAKMA
jgi:hypothetical protein